MLRLILGLRRGRRYWTDEADGGRGRGGLWLAGDGSWVC
jgi:hypothetical protein